jgi:hypothetical protein
MAHLVSVSEIVRTVTDLGLRVCPNLIKFYSTWKHAQTDAADLCKKTQRLQELITFLEAQLGSGVVPPDVAPVAMTQLKECEDQLRALEKAALKAISCKELDDGQILAKVKIQARRGMYPFKESTILKLQAKVAGACESLNLALQACQLYVARHVETHSRY